MVSIGGDEKEHSRKFEKCPYCKRTAVLQGKCHSCDATIGPLVAKLVKPPGLFWLLIEGNTYDHKEAIKDSGWGFFWSPLNRCWYVHPGTFPVDWKMDEWIKDHEEEWPGVRFRMVAEKDWSPDKRMAT